MESALYEGVLQHRRLIAPEGAFRYSLFMVYLDLAELDLVFDGRWLWSTRGPNLAWFRRSDHYGNPEVPLDQAVRDLVAEQTGTRPAGPVRLLTHLRYFGYGFNPVSFYYCFGADARTLETIVAEVSNTPWGERHMYVLPQGSSVSTPGPEHDRVFELEKAFHVSPFLGMDMHYRWQFGVPGSDATVRMENVRDGRRVFEASLSLVQKMMAGAEMARALVWYPAMTLKVVVSIYVQALRLFLRGATFYPHPRTTMKRQRHES